MIIAECRQRETWPVFSCCLGLRSWLPHTCSAYLFLHVCLLFCLFIISCVSFGLWTIIPWTGVFSFSCTLLPGFSSQGHFSFHKQIVFKIKSSGPCLCSAVPTWPPCPGWRTVELEWGCALPQWLSVCQVGTQPSQKVVRHVQKTTAFVSAQTFLLL